MNTLIDGWRMCFLKETVWLNVPSLPVISVTDPTRDTYRLTRPVPPFTLPCIRTVTVSMLPVRCSDVLTAVRDIEVGRGL